MQILHFTSVVCLLLYRKYALESYDSFIYTVFFEEVRFMAFNYVKSSALTDTLRSLLYCFTLLIISLKQWTNFVCQVMLIRSLPNKTVFPSLVQTNVVLFLFLLSRVIYFIAHIHFFLCILYWKRFS